MERLDKLLASTGRWSRREAKALIQAGRVLVDGMPARRGEDTLRFRTSVERGLRAFGRVLRLFAVIWYSITHVFQPRTVA